MSESPFAAIGNRPILTTATVEVHLGSKQREIYGSRGVLILTVQEAKELREALDQGIEEAEVSD